MGLWPDLWLSAYGDPLAEPRDRPSLKALTVGWLGVPITCFGSTMP